MFAGSELTPYQTEKGNFLQEQTQKPSLLISFVLLVPKDVSFRDRHMAHYSYIIKDLMH